MKKSESSSRIEQEALAILEAADVAMGKAVNDSSAEIVMVTQSSETHSKALARFRQTGTGLLEAVAAQTFFNNLDQLITPVGTKNIGKSADNFRVNFLDGQKSRVERTVSENRHVGFRKTISSEMSEPNRVLFKPSFNLRNDEGDSSALVAVPKSNKRP